MFRNEPLTDFAIASERKKLAEALDALQHNLVSKAPLEAYPLIGAERAGGNTRYDRFDPSDGETLLGSTHFATADEAAQTLEYLSEHHASWRATTHQDRARMLRKAAHLMRQRKFQLSALIIREAGKPWKEADADVAEAIDFCEYYADEVERIWPKRRTYEIIGEDNFYFYRPRGVCVVISPWNFPLAIACGMTVAALVTGNSTVLKPAEQTCLIAFAFANILYEAGIPKTAFAFLPGFGEEVGRALVSSPRTAMVCFTGSRAVGLEIGRSASQVSAGQAHIKRVVAELGGKNAIIVDQDADLDEAVKGVVYSAFGFSGQKCSACSRAIIVGNAYEPFIKRLRGAAADIIIGAASDPSTLVGPVIDEESKRRIHETIETASKRLTLIHKGSCPAKGNFCPPTIFGAVPSQEPVWREEIFGPVLACCSADSFEHAIALANDSQYALTGGVFSRSPAHLTQATEEFQVGNLYLNRAITGAYVCRQPFGGFKLSGVGSKAGGPDYLLQFVEPRVVTENTMRRGFTPEVR